MARGIKTAPTLWQQKIDEAKKEYFHETLAPYIDDGVLNTKRLSEENRILYREFMVAWRGIRNGCKVLGIAPSEAAKKAVKQPINAQIRKIALQYINEKGIDETASVFGITTNEVENIINYIENPPTTKRGRKPKSDKQGNSKPILESLDDIINELEKPNETTAATIEEGPTSKKRKK